MSSSVPAAEQTLALLRFLASKSRPASAAEIARELRLPRSTTYHLLAVLRAHGFVTHLPEERRYGLGVAVFEVGSAYLRHSPLERIARPVLARLVAQAATPIVGHLGTLHGREILYLVKQTGPRSPALVTDVGVRLPAHLTATGRAILAVLPRAQVRALFSTKDVFVNLTGSGPDSPGALRDLLVDERRQGWAAEDGEVTVGYASIAAPTLDHAGRPVASIGATFARRDLPPDHWPELASCVCAAARVLTDRLHGG